MGEIARQSAWNTVISYGGVFLGFITTIWLYPNILNPDQYGLTRVIISLTFVCVQFADLGVRNTILRFFPYFRDPEDNDRGFLFLILMVPLLGFIILCGVLFLIKDWILGFYADKSALLLDYIQYVPLLIFFELFYGVISNYVRIQYNTLLASFLKDVLLRIVIIVLLILYFFNLITFHQFVLFFILDYGLQLILLAFYIIRLKNVSLLPDFSFLRKKLAKYMASYSFFLLLGGVATIVVSNIDILMLSSITGLNNTAVYAIAFYIGSVIAIPKRSIEKIAIPFVSDALRKKNIPLIEDIYVRTSLNQTIAGGLLLCGVWVNIENIMGILPEAYRGSGLVIILIGFANLFDMATGINGGIIALSKYYRFDLYFNLFLVLLAVITNFYLIPIYGIDGAALATAFSIFIYNLAKYVFVWKKFSIQPFRKNILGVLLIGALSLYVAGAVPRLANLYLDILLRSAVLTSIYLSLILIFRLSEDVNNLVIKIVNLLKRIAGIPS